MAKIYKIEVEAKGKTPDQIEKEINEAIKSIVEEEFPNIRELEQYCDSVIKALIGLAKEINTNEVFRELADDYLEYMLSADFKTKASFTTNFILAVEDAIDDIIGLVNEHKMLSKGNKKGNEKKSNTKKELPK